MKKLTAKDRRIWTEVLNRRGYLVMAHSKSSRKLEVGSSYANPKFARTAQDVRDTGPVFVMSETTHADYTEQKQLLAKLYGERDDPNWGKVVAGLYYYYRVKPD